LTIEKQAVEFIRKLNCKSLKFSFLTSEFHLADFEPGLESD